MPLPEFPDDWFTPPDERPDDWPDFPEVRAAVEWILSYVPHEEWIARRLAAANRLYAAASGELIDPTGLGRFFDNRDQIAWVLFLGEAYIDHRWNYEPMYGSRVIAVLHAIGRRVDLLTACAGIDVRMNRLVGAERAQPNGGLFELLVAAAYLREGFTVEFVPEDPERRTHDLNVSKGEFAYAVECKRMEVGEQGERERARIREIWTLATPVAVRQERSAYCTVTFNVPMEAVPDAYLQEKMQHWIDADIPIQSWEDEFGAGTIREPDLAPLAAALAADQVLLSGSRFMELVTGEYHAQQNISQLVRYQHDGNPRFASECDLVVILRWKSASEQSISAKARDVRRKLSDANDQLPEDCPGIIHVGLEALDEMDVERRRGDRIQTTTGLFDPEGKPLRWIYVHHFVPQSPPNAPFIFDETVQWRRVGHHLEELPIGLGMLVTSDDDLNAEGGHWDRPFDN